MPTQKISITLQGDQRGRGVRLLAGVYNRSEFPLDLTDPRMLDTELAHACLDDLSDDRLGKRGIHHHLSGGDRELHQGLTEKTGRDRYEMLDEPIDDLSDLYRRKNSASKR